MSDKELSRAGEDSVTRGDIPTAATAVAEAQHSPLPWALTSQEGPDHRGVETFSVCSDDSLSGMSLEGEGGTHQCVARVRGASDRQSEANAEFIVRACNSHGELLAALKAADAAINPKGLGGISLHNWNERLKAATEIIRAAIAKAEGR